MSEPQTSRTSLPLKFLAGFAVGAVLGFGLCTAGALSGGQRWDNAAGFGAGCFFVCLGGVVVSVIWLIVAGVAKRP